MPDFTEHSVRGYEVRDLLGAGGFGAVYRAIQPILGREVAIKVILPQYANEPNFIRNFEFEAQLVARLEHPHIVPLFDYWRSSEGAYIVMRYLRGGSLRQLLNQGALKAEQAVSIVNQIASALAFSHRQQVIHRDVKPQNIMMDDEGNAYLSDFGIALNTRDHDLKRAEEGFVGSVAYAAPEMIKTEGIIAPSDIYALGIIVYEMLAGQHPFANIGDASLIMRQLQDPLPALPSGLGYSPEVDEVIGKATAKEVHQRYADAQELAHDFQRALLGERASLTLNLSQVPLHNPYKGLRAFTEADALDFFGREILTHEILERLREPTEFVEFLALVGPSGCGKTSIVQAGLIPAIRHGAITGADEWFIVETMPSAHPIQALANALLSVAQKPVPDLVDLLHNDPSALVHINERLFHNPKSQLFVVIDSFEQVYTLCEDVAERQHFLDMLYETAYAVDAPIRLVVVLRADYYDRPLENERFAKLLQERTHLMMPMTSMELERAIVAPAERVGVTVERAFVNAVLEDVRGQPASLPLLQFALYESFERCQGRTLTLEAYAETGGIFGALSKRSEEVYEALIAEDAQHESLIRQLFLRLVKLNDNGSMTRRKTPRATLLELGKPASVNLILDRYGDAYLMSFEGEVGTREPLVEIAHDALIYSWWRLGDWLEAHRDDLKTERLLAEASDAWQAHERDASYLLTGVRLSQLEAWVSKTTLLLTPHEREFVHQSVLQRQTDSDRQAAQQRRELELAQRAASAEHQSAVRSRWLSGLMLVAALIALGLALVAFNAQRAAEAQRQVVEQQKDTIEAQKADVQARADEVQTLIIAFNALLELAQGKNDTALALALNAAERPNPPSPVTGILVQAAYSLGTRKLYEGHQAPVLRLALSPDGRSLASVSGRYSLSQTLAPDNTVRLWDIATGAELQRFTGHADAVWDVAFTQDGTRLASASADGTVRLWNIATGAELQRFTGNTADVRSLAISPDDQRLLSGSWRLNTSGDRIDARLHLWDIATGTEICQMVGTASEVRRIAFLKQGTQAIAVYGSELSSEGDNVGILWDLATCSEVRRFEGHSDIVQDLAISPDERTLYTASADYTLIAWDIATGEMRQLYIGHSDWVNAVALSTDGQTLISGGWDNTIIAWDALSGRQRHVFIGHQAPIQGLVFAQDGLSFFSSAQDRQIRQWQTDSALYVGRVGDSNTSAGANALAYSPDKQSIYVGTPDGIISQWDIATGTRRAQFSDGHSPDTYIYELELSEDGQTLYSNGSDGLVIIWDTLTGQARHILRGHEGRVWRIALSADGTRLASASDDGTLCLWDTQTGEGLHCFDQGLSEVYAVSFALEGKLIAAGTLDGAVVWLDAERYSEVSRSIEHRAPVWVSAVSADGKWVATGGYDNAILLWDAQTRQVVQRMDGHAKTVAGLAFSRDGTRLYSTSFDASLRVWDTQTGISLGQLSYDVGITTFDIAPDESEMALASDAAPVLRYHLPSLNQAELIAFARATRWIPALTCAEQARFGIGCEE